MSCKDCNSNNTPKITLPAPPQCADGNPCAEVYPSDCIVYSGPNLPCKGVQTGELFTSALQKLAGCLVTQATSCITLSGQGIASNPLRATPKVSTASNNVLKCTSNGLSVAIDQETVTLILEAISSNNALKLLFQQLVCETDCNNLPTCVAPSGLSGLGSCNSNEFSLQADWSSNGASLYEYRIKKSTQSEWQTGTIANYSGSTGTLQFNGTVNGAALAAGDQIQVEVRNICTGLTSSWVSTTIQIPACTTCDTLASLQSSPTCDSVTLSWVLGNNTAVLVEYKLASDSTWTAVNDGDDITTSSVEITGLTQATNYNWRIKGKCPDDSYSEWILLNFSTSLCGTPPTCPPPTNVTAQLV